MARDRSINLAKALVESEIKRKGLEREAAKYIPKYMPPHLDKLASDFTTKKKILAEVDAAVAEVGAHEQFWKDYGVLLDNMAVGQKDVYLRIRRYVEKLEREAK